MADRTKPAFSAFLVHDRRASLWNAQSTYTQAGPEAGDPTPAAGQDSGVVLSASGDQTATVHVRCGSSGHPGDGTRSLGLHYREDVADQWRGWQSPIVSLGWEAVDWTTGAVYSTAHFDAVTLSNGKVVAAYLYDTGAITTIKVKIRATSGTWTKVSIDGVASATTAYSCPSLVLLPSGRLLCSWWSDDGTWLQVLTHYSDDDGATWAELREGCLDASVDATTYAVTRSRIRLLDGNISLMAEFEGAAAAHTVRQWVSYDLGSTYQYIEEIGDHTADATTITGPYGFDLVSAGGKLVFVGLYRNTAGPTLYTRPETRVIGSASQPLSTALIRWLQADEYVAGTSMAMCSDESGIVYRYIAAIPIGGLTTYGATLCSRSADYGETWEALGSSDWTNALAVVGAFQDAGTYLTGLAATWHRGRVLLIHQWVAAPGDEDASMGCLYLGGYSTVTTPAMERYPTDNTVVGFPLTWLPMDLPGDVGWGATVGGTNTLTAGGLNLTGEAYYTRTLTGTIAEGVIARIVVAATSGGSITADDVYVRIITADGVNDYDLRIRLSGTQIRFYDAHAGAALGTVTVTTTAGVEILVSSAGGDVVSWYRVRDFSEDHEWTAGPGGVLLTDAVTPGATNAIHWGQYTGSTATSTWWEVHACYDEYTGMQLTTWATPTDLAARPLGGSPTYVSSGLLLAATSGPGTLGETWTCTPEYQYAVSRVSPYVDESPRRGWRSTADNALTYIAFDLTSANTETVLETDIVGLALLDTNIETCTLQGYDADTSAWVDLVTLSAVAGGSSVRWLKRGNSVIPDTTAGNATPYLFRGDLDGGTFTDGTNYAHITTHTEGRFGPNPAGSLVRRAVVDCGALTAFGASGLTGKLIAPRMYGICKLRGATYRGYRIKIPAQHTADDYYAIGTAVLGPVVVMGQRPSWGRAVELQQGDEITERRDRTRAVYEAAPPARLIEVAWPDGVDMTDAYDDTTPDYIRGDADASAVAVASPCDWPHTLEGLVMQVRSDALVYLPSLLTTGQTGTGYRREDAILGYLEGPIRRETVVGNESDTELVRVSTITLREIV